MTTSGPVHEISPEQLPETIKTYLAAHQARDIDAAVSHHPSRLEPACHVRDA